jgi:hypothetical protein
MWSGDYEESCLLPAGEAGLLAPWCVRGVVVRTGLEDVRYSDGGWWDPSDTEGRAPERCYGDPQGYEGWTGWRDNPVTFDPQPETGTTTLGEHAVEWFRWSATCAEGQQFTAESWRVTDLGIELSSYDGSTDPEVMVMALVLDQQVPAFTRHVVELSEPVGEVVAGEVQDWSGSWQPSGQQVSFPVTEDSHCLATREGGQTGVDLDLAACTDLEADTDDYPVVSVVVDPEDDVIVVHVLSGH